MNAKATAALAQYTQGSVQASATAADPHRLIQMLLEGALDKIAAAKGYMERGQHEEKGRHISWAVSIINGLRRSLDLEAGGDISANLDALYDYSERRLMEGLANNNTVCLDEVAGHLREIKAGWDAIPESVKAEHAGRVAAK
jgi:flagellar protein FliS